MYWQSDSMWYRDLYHTHLKYEVVQQVILKQIGWRIYSVKCVFWHKLVTPKYHHLFLMIWTGNICSFIKLLTIFSAVIMPLFKLFNSMKYKSKYPNTIWWIIPYINMTKLYGYDRNDNGIMLNKMIYWEHPKQDSNSNI